MLPVRTLTRLPVMTRPSHMWSLKLKHIQRVPWELLGPRPQASHPTILMKSHTYLPCLSWCCAPAQRQNHLRCWLSCWWLLHWNHWNKSKPVSQESLLNHGLIPLQVQCIHSHLILSCFCHIFERQTSSLCWFTPPKPEQSAPQNSIWAQHVAGMDPTTKAVTCCFTGYNQKLHLVTKLRCHPGTSIPDTFAPSG